MLERRNPMYVFTSEKALTNYFHPLLAEERIKVTLIKMRQQFIRRKSASRSATKLQYLKKCECEFFRMTKEKSVECEVNNCISGTPSPS